jgi:hypothetical protein
MPRAQGEGLMSDGSLFKWHALCTQVHTMIELFTWGIYLVKAGSFFTNSRWLKSNPMCLRNFDRIKCIVTKEKRVLIISDSFIPKKARYYIELNYVLSISYLTITLKCTK